MGGIYIIGSCEQKKNVKAFTIVFLIFILLFSMAACGTNSTETNDQQADDQQADDQAATDQQITAVQAVPEADTNALVDNLIGSWTNINSSDRYITITKTESGFLYEDNEGKYDATFENGILKVKVADSETADVYIEAETGHLLSVYQGDPSEFEKK